MHNQPYAFLGCGASYEEADFVLFGAPFDSTTSFRPGARFGPSAMRADSLGIETYSFYQDRELTAHPVFDAGDLELSFGDPSVVVEDIRSFTATLLKDGKRPAMLGGEHLVTLGAVTAVAAQYPDLRLLHLDAHADLRQTYLGADLSHACVIRRCWDILGDGRVYQFGIRSGSEDEAAFAAAGHVTQRRFDCAGFAETLDALGSVPLYVTLDLDVLDPSLFSGTGTPEAGGVAFTALMDCIMALEGRNVRGFDLCELAPHYDASGASTATACKLLRELLLACCA